MLVTNQSGLPFSYKQEVEISADAAVHSELHPESQRFTSLVVFGLKSVSQANKMSLKAQCSR